MSEPDTSTGHRLSNPIRGRLNAATLRAVDRYAHLLVGARKRVLFADLPDQVVEIGPGTGANLRYYRPGTRLVAIEPNVHMHGPLRAAARRHVIDLELRAGSAERIALPDACVDAVVSTLVLCTVPDPVAAVEEAWRVLRPGGRLLFLEHVRADGGYGRLQRLAARPWHWLFEGCDVRRDTERAIRDAGFTSVELQRYSMRSAFLPINPQIAGTAIR
ncbi:class I SAM-dependent methyltransferase [Jiangella alkaliphila]|uniref:Ubiquinone/menaquinone biosynthesis C-methylase UbiE n=1 Tax=Jiangella alkaliphila TaxID=419479 RepID=A0A1H2K7W6_9ACTN|nr:class I SAM-dependent methyltransferase [Jiangella alkaliphila]SDU64405.1 Ubiquinone/menaquinone biosynthesis C-methylase UbiE [Jiangella alkaliphila]